MYLDVELAEFTAHHCCTCATVSHDVLLTRHGIKSRAAPVGADAKIIAIAQTICRNNPPVIYTFLSLRTFYQTTNQSAAE
jgi:hypothetical protein